jgi:outer membrane protein OmpA-like peptidoglycan-associated protein
MPLGNYASGDLRTWGENHIMNPSTRVIQTLCAVVLAVTATTSLSRSQIFEPAVRLAQAEPPGEKKPPARPGGAPQQRAPNQPAPQAPHPPAANAPPAHQGPPPAAQTPHPAPPAPVVQTPPNQPAQRVVTPLPGRTPSQPGSTPPVQAPVVHAPPQQPLRSDGGPGAVVHTPPPQQPGVVPGAVVHTPQPQPLRPGGLGIANVPLDPNAGPRHLDQLRGERHEVHEGNRTVIQEADRTIVREGGLEIIRHNEADRFRVNAREVAVERRGEDTVTVALRPDGSRIITEVDPDGRLVRRIRRDPEGREVIIIDNSFEPRRAGPASYFVDLPPPMVRVPRELYVRDLAGANAEDVYLTLMAPPVDRIERRYALDEIRYSEPLRLRMPRVDIDTVNFETASWEIAPSEVQRLAFVADAIMRALRRNPREVFLIEGYTDAVGNDLDNLSLSDRRAEAVAVALTNQFGIPPENLTTQGYGKQFLKIPTDGPERANRRVAVRRITPLLMGQG